MSIESNSLQVYTDDFPFKQITPSSGDYFYSAQQARKAGFVDSQIWSVVESEDAGFTVYVYGPHYHHINVVGFIATNEFHDGNTYYEEF
jgi:hypothetical protein